MGHTDTKKLLVDGLKPKLHWVLAFAFAGVGNTGSREAGQAAGEPRQREAGSAEACLQSEPSRAGVLCSGATQSMAI